MKTTNNIILLPFSNKNNANNSSNIIELEIYKSTRFQN